MHCCAEGLALQCLSFVSGDTAEIYTCTWEAIHALDSCFMYEWEGCFLDIYTGMETKICTRLLATSGHFLLSTPPLVDCECFIASMEGDWLWKSLFPIHLLPNVAPSLAWPHPIPQQREGFRWFLYSSFLLHSEQYGTNHSTIFCHVCYRNFNRKLQCVNQLWNHKQLLPQSSQNNYAGLALAQCE